jgi:hypothetical protein
MMLVASYALIAKDTSHKLYIIIRTGATVIITITGLGYHLLLSGTHNPQGIHQVANILLHYLVPILSISSWFLVLKKKSLKWHVPFLWIIYPIIYIIGSSIRGALSGKYPYWFVNPTKVSPDGIGSYGNLLKVVGMLAIVYLALGYMFRWINNKIAKND